MLIKVSIVLPLYNSERFVSDSIESVIKQTFKDWELIIVDDCSPDNSVAIVEDFMSRDSRIKLIRMEYNFGAAVARNKAIKMAKGRYIAFLDSDDVWLPSKLKDQYDFMQLNSAVLTYSAYRKIDEIGNVIANVGVPIRVNYNDMLKLSSIGCLTAMYDSEELGKIYMPLIRKRQDLGLWLRILKVVPYAHATPGVLAHYRVRNDSISANKRVAAQYTWKLYRDIEGLSFFRAAYFFSFYAVNGVLRTKLPSLARILGVLK